MASNLYVQDVQEYLERFRSQMRKRKMMFTLCPPIQLVDVHIPDTRLRWFVKKIRLLRPIWIILACISLGYFSFSAWYFVFVKELSTTAVPHHEMFNVIIVYSLTGSLVTTYLILFCFGVLMVVVILHDPVDERTRRGKIMKCVRITLKHLINFLASSGFNLLSAYLGHIAYEDDLLLHIIASFILFVVFTCMACWTVGDLGVCDCITAVLLGLLIGRKVKLNKLTFVLAAVLPALKHLVIPFGTFLSGWADKPKKIRRWRRGGTYAVSVGEPPRKRRRIDTGESSNAPPNVAVSITIDRNVGGSYIGGSRVIFTLIGAVLAVVAGVCMGACFVTLLEDERRG